MLHLLILVPLLAALVILGFAGPLLNAHSELQGKRALMLVVDDGWAAAPGWPDREHSMAEAVDEAERYKIPVILLTTAPSPDGGAIAASGRPQTQAVPLPLITGPRRPRATWSAPGAGDSPGGPIPPTRRSATT